jgi:hypothetical protein
MWDTIISREPEKDTTKKYLGLLLEEEDYLETLSAENLVSQGSARALMKALSSAYPGRFFYSKEDMEISEVLQLPPNLANLDYPNHKDLSRKRTQSNLESSSPHSNQIRSH